MKATHTHTPKNASAQRVTFTCRGCSAELFSRLAKKGQSLFYLQECRGLCCWPNGCLHYYILSGKHSSSLLLLLLSQPFLPAAFFSSFCSVLFRCCFFFIRSACSRRAANIPFSRTRSRHEDVKVTRYISFFFPPSPPCSCCSPI